jgi:succinoglycan biosynthesis protein ExoL
MRRTVTLLRTTFTLLGLRKRLVRASCFYARNVDQLMLAIFARKLLRARAWITYEVLDIQPAFVGKGLRARLLRLIERWCLTQVSLIVVSSPGFMRSYYEPIQRYRGNWFLLENKLHASAVPALSAAREALSARNERNHGYKWVVSYAGLIRGQRTFDLIARLAERFETEVLFRFHGILTTVDPDIFAATIERQPNMLYCGEYVNPRDLVDIYRDTDFVWAIDLENADNNSRWLLPCRFYEAGYLGLPCLAARDFEVGRKVEALGAGWAFPDPFEDTLTAFLTDVTPEEYGEKRRRLSELPASTFIAGDDAAALCHFISDDAILRQHRRRHRLHRTGARRLFPAHAGFHDSRPMATD